MSVCRDKMRLHFSGDRSTRLLVLAVQCMWIDHDIATATARGALMAMCWSRPALVGRRWPRRPSACRDGSNIICGGGTRRCVEKGWIDGSSKPSKAKPWRDLACDARALGLEEARGMLRKPNWGERSASHGGGVMQEVESTEHFFWINWIYTTAIVTFRRYTITIHDIGCMPLQFHTS